VIQVLLGLVAVVILPGAVFLMLKMDGGSRTQERLYVAIAALVVLGAVDSQVQRLVRRRVPFSLETTVEERRYIGVSLVLMFVAAVVLIGLALLLP
jgi:cytochrome bd-type quinol oxidase subunit 2